MLGCLRLLKRKKKKICSSLEILVARTENRRSIYEHVESIINSFRHLHETRDTADDLQFTGCTMILT